MFYEEVRKLGRVHRVETFGYDTKTWRTLDEKRSASYSSFCLKGEFSILNKRKEELIELCVNAQDLNVAQLETDEACEVAIENKLRTPEGDLPKPANLTHWTNNFYKAPEFTFADLFVFVVEKKGYDKKSLRAFKSLQGYRLNADGHVEELSYHSIEGGGGLLLFQVWCQANRKIKNSRWGESLSWLACDES